MPVAGVVGVTGLVGRTMMEILQERSFPVERFLAFASDASASEGRSVRFDGLDCPVQIISPDSISKGTVLFGATSADVAREWIPGCVSAGAVIIDNSSAFRMDPGVPLVVPEVNGGVLTGREGLIANPNCSTIQLVLALAPLAASRKILWVSIATYQSVSGAGTPALEELQRQIRGAAPTEGNPVFSGNVVTSIGPPSGDGYCGEEIKLMMETSRIMGTDFPVYASTARVPVRIGHTEAVTVKFVSPFPSAEAAAVLAASPGVRVSASGVGPVDVEGTDEVFVDRIRNFQGDPSVLQMWVIADNVRKGAALNAVQIAELLLKLPGAVASLS
jgi:aspartate-semialdehyde dehydrogenase